MSNIQTRNNASTAIAALDSLKAGLQNVTTNIAVAGGVPILRMLTDGTFVYGAENIEVEHGSVWAANLHSLRHGWVAWTDRPGNQKNEVVDEVAVPMSSPLPSYTELPDVSAHKAAWKQMLTVEFLCLNGTDKGETVVYKPTSVGGMNAMKALLTKVQKQLNEDPSMPIPMVQFSADFYMHNKHGKTWFPVIEITDWAPLSDDMPEVDDPEPVAPQPKAEPVRTRRSTPAVKPKEEPVVGQEEPEQKAAPTVTAADRRAALLAELESLKGDEQAEDEKPAADEPRRRRRA